MKEINDKKNIIDRIKTRFDKTFSFNDKKMIIFFMTPLLLILFMIVLQNVTINIWYYLKWKVIFLI